MLSVIFMCESRARDDGKLRESVLQGRKCGVRQKQMHCYSLYKERLLPINRALLTDVKITFTEKPDCFLVFCYYRRRG